MKKRENTFMKIYTTNYQNTFIEIAEDCTSKRGEIPPEKKTGKTAANLQYENFKQKSI